MYSKEEGSVKSLFLEHPTIPKIIIFGIVIHRRDGKNAI